MVCSWYFHGIFPHKPTIRPLNDAENCRAVGRAAPLCRLWRGSTGPGRGRCAALVPWGGDGGVLSEALVVVEFGPFFGKKWDFNGFFFAVFYWVFLLGFEWGFLVGVLMGCCGI